MFVFTAAVLAFSCIQQISTPDTVVVEASLQIGTVEGDDNFVFGLISGIDADQGGRILVSDFRLTRVQVYDSTGDYLQTVGRLGHGPGELQAPSSVAALRSGIWALVDVGSDAYLWFDDQGGPIARRRRPRERRFAREPIRADRTGAFLDSRRGYDRSYHEFTIVRVQLNAEDLLTLDSLHIEAIPETGVRLEDPGIGFRGGVFRVPFAPYTVWTPIDGGVAYSVDGTYLIQRSYFDGSADTLIHRQSQHGDPIPAVLAEKVLATPVADLKRLGQRVGADSRSWIEQITIPNRFPPVLGLFSDPFGRIWVLTGDQRGRPVLDVWNQSGDLLGTIALATGDWPEIEKLAISGSHILGIFEGELGVQVVRGFSIPEALRGG